jgi:hypothetical protein
MAIKPPLAFLSYASQESGATHATVVINWMAGIKR